MKYVIVAFAFPFAAVVAGMSYPSLAAAPTINHDDAAAKPSAEWLKNNVVAQFWWGAAKESHDAYAKLDHRVEYEAVELIDYAKKPAKDAQQQERRARILELLGEYGSAPGVIEFLIDNIEVKAGDPSGTWWQSGDVADHPCVRSLIHIGQSSVPRILEHLTRRQLVVDDKTIDLYAYVLLYAYIRPPITGGHAEALGVVERAAARVPKERREHLDRLAAAIRRIVDKEPIWRALEKRDKAANAK